MRWAQRPIYSKFVLLKINVFHASKFYQNRSWCNIQIVHITNHMVTWSYAQHQNIKEHYYNQSYALSSRHIRSHLLWLLWSKNILVLHGHLHRLIDHGIKKYNQKQTFHVNWRYFFCQFYYIFFFFTRDILHDKTNP